MNGISRILLKLSFVVLLISAPLCVAARALGEKQPASPTMRGFKEGCQNAVDVCWYGVTINQTPINDIENTLKGHTYFIVRTSTKASAQNFNKKNLPCGAYFLYEYDKVNGLVIRCQGLLLGDWINHFGMPDGVGQFHDVLYYAGKTKMRLQIIGALTPDAPIVEFALYIPRALSEYEYDWRGFAPRWRYCQLNTFNPCT